MAFKHYDLVSARTVDELKRKLNEKIGEGWQPYGAISVSSVSGTEDVYHQPVAAEGDVTTPVVVKPSDSGDGTDTQTQGSTTGEPEYYYVLATAGQSNSMSFGEGLPLPDTHDRPDPRIKQLARRSKVTPTGETCSYNDIIPADHCLHDVQDMSILNHPHADLTKGQYGCVGHALHVAKKLLPFIPVNAGILLVPCGRGDSGFTSGAEGVFDETSGATAASSLWGVDKPLYQDLVTRTRAALKKNPKNILLSVIWMQGEKDVSSGRHAEHGALFLAMVNKFRTDLADVASQCTGGSPSSVPWICGDTTYYWKERYAEPYGVVYGGYKNKADQNIYFVPFMTDENNVNVPTNEPTEDPDITDAGYYGAASRTAGNWTTSDRKTHFSSWSRRGIISDRLATAVLVHAGRTLPFLTGQSAPITGGTTSPQGGTTQPSGSDTGGGTSPSQPQPSSPAQPQPGSNTSPADENIIISYSSGVSGGRIADQGWQASGGAASIVDDTGAAGGKAVRISKSPGQMGSWKMTHTATPANAAALLANGGEIAFRFRIPDDATLAANRYALALYWPVSALPEGVTPEGDAGSNMLAAFFIQSDTANLNLMYHKAQNQKLGTFGAFDHDWHSVAFRFAGGNSISVVPVIDGVAQAAFNLAKCPATGFTADTLLISDITGNQATYPVLTDSITVGVNAAAPAA